MVSVCSGTDFSKKAQDVVSLIFRGLESEEIHTGAELSAEQAADRESSIEYWKNAFKDAVSVQSLPGYITNTVAENCSVVLPMNWEVCDKIRDLSDAKKIGRRAIFLMAWGELQGRYNSADEVFLLLRSSGKVEESMIGSGGVVKSVSLRKKGDVIGIRALLEKAADTADKMAKLWTIM